ncbi:MAG: hypothetical protein ABWZ99_07080 [Ilumatobacteraceae bacterium]
MPTWTLAAIENVIRDSWSEETCDTVDLPWSRSNPAKGQCGVTALVLNDLLGGDLMVADVTHADGTPQGSHTWNVLHGGVEIDLTSEQFRAGEVVQSAVLHRRPSGPPRRLPERYELLRERVLSALGVQST